MIYPEKEWDLIGFKRATGMKKIIAILRNKESHKTKQLSFGQRGSSTFWDRTEVGGDPTHHDEAKRKAYRARHKKAGPKYSPSWLSWTYLWIACLFLL